MTIQAGQRARAADVLKSLNADGYLELADSTALTIASGAISVAQNFHRVDTEGAAASDDLDTITPGSGVGDGFVLVLRPANDARTVVVKHNTGNILCVGNADLQMDDAHDLVVLVYDVNLLKWMALSGTPYVTADPVWEAQGDLLVGTGDNAAARLAKGTADQVLRMNSGATSPEWATPNPKTEDATTAETTGNNTETTLYSFTLPGGKLSTNNILLVEVWLDGNNNEVGSVTIEVRLKYGGTQMVVFSYPFTGTGGTAWNATVRFALKGDGSANAQEMHAALITSRGNDNNDQQNRVAKGTAAINSAADQTVVVACYSGANTQYTARIGYALLLINM